MFFNMASTVRKWQETIEVVKRNGGYDANGRFQITDSIELNKATVQPAPKEMLQNLPEGAQRIGAKLFWLTNKLNIIDEKLNQVSDKIIYKSKVYKLTEATNWEEFGFFKYLGTLDQA